MLNQEQVEIVKQEMSKKGQKKIDEATQKLQSTLDLAIISEKLVPQLDSDIKELCNRGLARLADKFNDELIRFTKLIQQQAMKIGIAEAPKPYISSIHKLCEDAYRLVHNPNIGDMKLLSEHMQSNIKSRAESIEQNGYKEKAEGYISKLYELSTNRNEELQQFKENKGVSLSELEDIYRKHYNLLKAFYEELFEYKS